MTRYRAEIYDNEFNFISFGALSDKDLKVDYLAEETSTVTIPSIITASIGNYINVREDGTIFIYGIVTNVSYDENKTVISFTDFSTILNVDVMEDITVFSSTDVETWFSTKLTALFAGDDDSQNIYGFSVTTTSTTTISYTASSADSTFETINLYTFMQSLLQKYSIMFTWTVDFSAQTVVVSIGTIDTTSAWNLRLGLADTPDYTIDIHTVEGTYNKILYYNTEDITDTVTYYLHSDGTIDTDSSTDRLTPVTYIEKTATADTTEGAEKTFEEVALEDAEASMLNTDFNHEIDVTFNSESKLVDVGNIGQIYNLVTESGVTYNTILTGFENVNTKYIKLIFGYVRTDLTKILKMQMQRRNK